ncbi:MAG: LTA synthase family protein [Clostridiales bacterium]|nr:LTA synthase family protein [Clostridiales bacterium]
MSFKAFLLYPGMVCMVGLIAMLGAFLELRLLHKDAKGKEAFGKFVYSTFFITLITLFFVKFNHRTKHFLYLDDVHADAYVFGFIVVVLVAAAKILLTAILKKYRKPYTEAEEKKKPKALSVTAVVLFAFGITFFLVGHFIPATWAGVRPEQMIVNLISPTEGTELSIYLTGFEYVILAVGATVLFGILCLRRTQIEIPVKQRTVTLLSRKAKAVVSLLLTSVMFVSSIFFISDALSLPIMYKIFFVPSDFIEKEYVDLRDVKVTFPEQKRNLIYIYLESMENSYLSKELGGYMDENLMPELTELAYEGDVFSNTSGKFGGPVQVTGTEWTRASMVNQTLGVPMKAPMNLKAYTTPGHFLGGIYGLGDLLHDNGYIQTYLVGDQAKFAGGDLMFKTHGDFAIKDYDYALETGMIPEGYKVWWGFEDDKLFKFAKEELLALSQSGRPFNLTLATIDTHATGGYLPEGAPTPYDDPYSNSIAYNTKRVTEFVRWVQKQPFYENTTIIMIGDHHSMDGVFFKDFDKNYKRTTFNLILNPASSVADTDASRFINRIYANFDMFPTTLAALGCDIERNRAGIGVNLYSSERTLLEAYGIDIVNGELQKRSDFYNHTLVDVE